MYYQKTVNTNAKSDEDAVVKEYEKYILEQIKPKLEKETTYAKAQHEQDIQRYESDKLKSICTPRLLSSRGY